MIRSLRTGITGLTTHQTKMDVIGNNIANVNTIAYKRSRATFKEMLGQQNMGSGVRSKGVNATFIGYGARVGGISQNWQQGSLENTNIGTDLALDGDGFFMIQGVHQRLLTRDGSFRFNEEGQLVTTDGLPVLGYPIDANGEADTSHIEEVSLNYGVAAAPKFTENVTIDGNLSAETATGDTVVMSHQIYDEQGESHNFLITFTKTANANEWDYQIEYDGDLTPPPFSTQNGTFTFNTQGQFDTPPTLTLPWDSTYVTGGPDVTFNLEDVTQYSGSDTALVRDQDGYTFGRLLGYHIDDRGKVTLSFSNGQIQHVAQLALATIDNPNGLSSTGQNNYVVTAESGELHLGRAGQEMETSIIAGSLEMSNVDLAREFTDMIVAQRGYQASARVITTSDELLQETVSLKR